MFTNFIKAVCLFLPISSFALPKTGEEGPTRAFVSTVLPHEFYQKADARIISQLSQHLKVKRKLLKQSPAMVNGGDSVSAFVTLAGEHDIDVLATTPGINIRCTAGDMALVTGLPDNIAQLSLQSQVVALAGSQSLEPQLFDAKQAIGLDHIHAGNNLTNTYNGAGVVCGIFDQGVDPNHINFMDPVLKSTRIMELYHYPSSTGNSTAYLGAEEIANFTTDSKLTTHGTHTIGCLAGSFNGYQYFVSGLTGGFAYNDGSQVGVNTDAPLPYTGAAPASDIIVGCGPLYSSNIVDAIDKFKKYARQHSQPLVINLSIGSILGSHDGAIGGARFINNQAADALLFVSAGNDGHSPISIQHTFNSSTDRVASFLSSVSRGSGCVEFWCSDSSKPQIELVVYDRVDNKIVFSFDNIDMPDYFETVSTSDINDDEATHPPFLDQYFVNTSFCISESFNTTTNNRYQAMIDYQFYPHPDNNANSRFIPGFIVKGANSGVRVDIVNKSSVSSLTSRNLEGWTDGSPIFSINDLACGKNVISVGAYTTKTSWPVMGGTISGYTNTDYQINTISPFSSYGTLVDGRNLPEIVAPGAAIMSSYSNYYVTSSGLADSSFGATYTYNGRNHHWASMQGTSMASPIAAGTVACWLQANPNLTTADVRNIFANTSTRPSESLGDDNLRWGAGKIEASKGLTYILKSQGLGNMSINADEPVLMLAKDECEIVWPGKNNLSVCMYTVQGHFAGKFQSNSDSLVISARNMPKGLYILRIEGCPVAKRIVL